VPGDFVEITPFSSVLLHLSDDRSFLVAWNGFQETICYGHVYHTLVVADLQA
jgi:hypothetical protein